MAKTASKSSAKSSAKSDAKPAEDPVRIIARDIKERTFRPVYLLFGEEAFLKKSCKNQLKDAILQGDTMNFQRFEGKDCNLQEILSLAATMPFFGERRLLLIEDSGYFAKGGEGEQLVKALEELPETTVLLFAESEVDKRGKLYKKTAQLGLAAEFALRKPEDLAVWAGQLLARENRKITRATMDLFLSLTGENMDNIRMELEKLISYTEGQNSITEEDVLAICSRRVEDHVFEMTAAMAGRNTGKALELYGDLLTLKVAPMRILFLIARQFFQLLQLKELQRLGQDSRSIASKMKLMPFIVSKLSVQARNFTEKQLRDMLERCVELEEAVKTGALSDQLAVELLITGNGGEDQ